MNGLDFHNMSYTDMNDSHFRYWCCQCGGAFTMDAIAKCVCRECATKPTPPDLADLCRDSIAALRRAVDDFESASLPTASKRAGELADAIEQCLNEYLAKGVGK